MMNALKVKEFLNHKVRQYNTLSYIETDPIQIPHRFTQKEDIEVAAFLTSIIAWGKRSMIINSAGKMMQLMDNSPYDFVVNHTSKDLDSVKGFVHRTFKGVDFSFFIQSLKNIYIKHSGLEFLFATHIKQGSVKYAIHEFKKVFFEIPYPIRTTKHIADPMKNSAAKRINMFLRWMVRQDNCGVDFGIWNTICPSVLSCPLDVHSGNIGRKLGLITRKQNDWKALEELDSHLRAFDDKDPAKYDYALFGLGVFEDF